MKQTISIALDFISKYKIPLLLAVVYLQAITMTAAIMDVNKQDVVIETQSSTILQLTAKVIEQQVLLSEAEELLRIREDLSKVLP